MAEKWLKNMDLYCFLKFLKKGSIYLLEKTQIIDFSASLNFGLDANFLLAMSKHEKWTPFLSNGFYLSMRAVICCMISIYSFQLVFRFCVERGSIKE